MRDHFKPKADFDESITVNNEFIEESSQNLGFFGMAMYEYDESRLSRLGVKRFQIFNAFVRYFEYIPLRYSRGDAIADIVAKHNPELLHGLTHYAQLLAQINQQHPDVYSGWTGEDDGFYTVDTFKEMAANKDNTHGYWTLQPTTAGIYIVGSSDNA